MSKERLEDWEKAIIQCDKTKKVIIKLVDENTTLTERVQELEEENKRYREALEFYADEENYKPFDGIFLSSYQNKIDEDGGQTARKALEGEE